MSEHKITTQKSGLLLILITLFGFALRVYRLGAQSLWYDETVSAFLAAQPVPELIAHTARDIHPPGYYFLLHYWTLAAGNTEFALAYFSLIFGVLLIPLIYLLARYVAGKHIAIWAAALTAFSTYNIWYSQEVRMYTLGAALGLIAAYCALKAQSKHATASRWCWIGYIVAAAAGLYVLYYFAFLLIALNILFLVYALYPKIETAKIKALLIANGLVFVAYLRQQPIHHFFLEHKAHVLNMLLVLE